ncbi:hypothetical protein O181_009542 [Austropuccinia psidii MF-1]|uniref:Uncharacterized protein n=1 Tax=Austropuccinia psidii MF-1 TaxID=1389203 RepID=A0A9Q3GKE5_9BASI|nr:hypothetical protein [Austropuccinia psidii MF-1]
MHLHIVPAANTLMATKPALKVFPEDLLNMIHKIPTASPNFDHSTEIARVDSASKTGGLQPFKKDFPQQNFSQFTSGHVNIETSSSKNGTRPQSLRYPCNYCGKAVHWSLDYPN